MKRTVRWFLFQKPEGARNGAIYAALGLLLLGTYGFFLAWHAYRATLLLAIAPMYIIWRLVQFLPRERTSLAGACRVFWILYVIAVMAYFIFRY